MFKLLAVDDHEDILNIIKAKFSKNGFQVETVSDATMVMKAMEDFKPDIVFLDIMMPKITGFEICNTIKSNKAYKDVKVVFLTAKDMDFTRQKADELKADGFIAKPFSPQDLLDVAKSILVK